MSLTTSVTTSLSAAILETILDRLALLFLTGAGGDLLAARHAAAQMFAAYHAETEDERRLAAEIISFGFHALEALSQASDPDMSLTKILRLRGGAVSLSRESHKSQRKLDQLQRDRRAGIRSRPTDAQPAEADTTKAEASPETAPSNPTPSRPHIDRALALIEATRKEMTATGKPDGNPWSKSHQNRQAAMRIAQNLKKNQAIHLAAASSQAASDLAATTIPG